MNKIVTFFNSRLLNNLVIFVIAILYFNVNSVTGHAYSLSDAPVSFHEFPTADNMDTLHVRDDGKLQANWIIYSENEDGTLTVIGYDREMHDLLYDSEKDALRYLNNPQISDRNLYSLYIFNTVDGKKVTSIADNAFEGEEFSGIYIDSGINIGKGAFRDIVIELPACNPPTVGNCICIGTPLVDDKGAIILSQEDTGCAINGPLPVSGETTIIDSSAFEGMDINCPVVICCDCIINNSAFKKTAIGTPSFSFDMTYNASIVGKLGASAFENFREASMQSYIHLNLNKITDIGYRAFYNSGVRQITLPSSLQHCDDECFEVGSLISSRKRYENIDIFFDDPNTDISILNLKENSKAILHINSDSPAMEYCNSHGITWIDNVTGEKHIPSVTTTNPDDNNNPSGGTTTNPEDNNDTPSGGATTNPDDDEETPTTGSNNSGNSTDKQQENNSPSTNQTNNNNNKTIVDSNTEYLINHAYYRITGKNTVTFLRPDKTTYKTITIPDSVRINKKTYKVTKVADRACYKNKKLTTVNIGNNVSDIGNHAFANCSSLTGIRFGKKAKTLGLKVLYNDRKLKRITFKGTKIKSIGKCTFKNVPYSVSIVVPNSKVKKYSKLINSASK